MRIDKWLWAARFYKTRSLAAKFCELGRVTIQGVAVKPAREVKPGDLLLVKTPGGDFEVEIRALTDVRGPAPAARALYQETVASVEARARAAEERKAMPRLEAIPFGRPSKKNRRNLDRIRGRF